MTARKKKLLGPAAKNFLKVELPFGTISFCVFILFIKKMDGGLECVCEVASV